VSGLAADGPSPLRAVLGAWPYLLVAYLYFATWPFHHGLNNPNEMVRVYMSRAMALHGDPVIDPVIREWGGVDDKAIRDGRLYSSKAPLQSLIGAPIHRWLVEAELDKRQVTTTLRRFGSALPGLLFGWVLIAWCRRRATSLCGSTRLGTALGLALALGSMLYPYALTFTGHIWAAITAGGAYLGAVMLSRREAGSGTWRLLAIGTGALAGAAPFAEYPAALVAGPALAGAWWCTASWIRRAELTGWLALGGCGPFALGLWAHQQSWGSIFKTGYAFLENRAYVEVHKGGFFGVGAPSLEAFGGSLFSPDTGLFFFSPILLIGLITAGWVTFHRAARSADEITLPSEWASPTPPIDRRLAAIALLGCGLEFLFIAGHSGWRGGWTVGPRYIIPVAPILGLWVVESLGWRWGRWVVPPLAALSIVITGGAAALYPHLSDVYTNPIATFLWPSYRQGLTTYGLGHAIGLGAHAANLFHLVPLLAAVIFAATADAGARPRELAFAFGRSLLVVVLACAGIAAIPERDAPAAAKENERLWGFWEPRPIQPQDPALLFRARDRWRAVEVEVEGPPGVIDPCRIVPGQPDRCQYAAEPWQHFGPDHLEMAGVREPILFLHPIRGRVVRAKIPLGPGAKRARLRYGLADASVHSDNPTPVELALLQRGRIVGRAAAGNDEGLHQLELALTSTGALILELRSERDGARVFGFDLEVLKE
jgi:hypothetical protein